MKKLLIIFLSFNLHVLGARAEIRETQSMAVALTDVDPLDVVVFDIDNTILETQQTLGSDQWYGHRVEEYKKSGSSESQAIDAAIADWIRVQRVTGVKPVESVTPTLIRDLQARGVKVLALTARPIALKTETSRQLESIDVKFHEASDVGFSSKDVEFFNGILFVGPKNNKGVVLAEYLSGRNLNPKHLLFIDDKAKHVHNMDEIFALAPFANINFRYGAADATVKSYRSDIADVEWAYFNEHYEKLLTDQEAQKILNQ